MSLGQMLTELIEGLVAGGPAEAVAVMRKLIGDLEAAGIGNNALKAGDTLPDATLIDPFGEPVSIAELGRKGPMIINFYRGGWCPLCNLELRAYQNILGEIEAAGAQLIAVSPQNPDASLSTAEKNQLKFPVLTDPGNGFAKALGISFELPADVIQVHERSGTDLPAINSGAEWVLPIPAVYVVDSDGTILLAHVDSDFSTRLEPAVALAAVRTASPTHS
ncbi:peroxiredoxin-like family protein [Rhizorhabdus dicambivorans]|uniref:thioredoxin-dependent peroxiredoxin n=1 Tax=Rhizorhabdus dicambivorans TaxID=1850238 RepID=A0A2A4FUN1_9SPHN|nr:peroxiredoxin-like family protein [Rhizorhabdus dicambivorans]ATE65806.1 alkyl hydroperoxide reductase [Rhizorhabdus dicambivorans]PCE41111.1 alkyl hydroperoxide reductase [Rhizorhabdus dicambivorans]